MNTASITQSNVKQLVHYDGENLIWRFNRGNGRVGKVAGYVHSTGYRRTKINGVEHPIHRLIWLWVYGEWPQGEIDHINGDRTDNRVQNLRDVTTSINQRNAKKRNDNTTGIAGVGWSKRHKKWTVRIMRDGERIFLGYFDCKYHAASVRHFAQEIEGGYTDRHGK